MKFFSLGLLGLLPFAVGQTSSSCDPTKRDNCPADPALGRHVKVDLSQKSDLLKGPDSGTVSYGQDGAKLSINKSGDGPTLISNFYIMFGHVDVQLKMAPGRGIVSSLVLLSDDLDEIDFESLGGNDNQVHSNFFGHVDLTDYTNDRTLNVDSVNDDFHTYSIDWTADHITWTIDNKVSRTVTAQSAGNKYPQTPMQLKIGPWPAGDSDAQGTIEWAGGKVDWSKAPFEMYVKSIEVTDYSTGNEYSYKDRSGSWQSIQANNGKVNTNGKPAQGGTENNTTTSSNPTTPPSSSFTASPSESSRTDYFSPSSVESSCTVSSEFTTGSNTADSYASTSPETPYITSFPTNSSSAPSNHSTIQPFEPFPQDSGAGAFSMGKHTFAGLTLLFPLAMAIPAVFL